MSPQDGIERSEGRATAAVRRWLGGTSPSRVMLLAVLTAAVVAGGFLLGSPGLYEAWHLVLVILTGFAVASLGLLMIGHLLGDMWLSPIRDELEPASWTLPLLAVLALPLIPGLAHLFPWVDGAVELPGARRAYLSQGFFLLRAALYLIAWTALAVVIARAGRHRAASAVGLALVAATFSLAATDWVMSREPQWWSSLFGFAFAVSQLLAALAAAILVTVARQGHPESRELESLERALLTLALLTLWVWFAQFLVVWMADLPGEAQWYVVRLGAWGWLIAGVALPALLLAIVLLIPSRAPRWRILAACGLVLVHHVAHMVWVIRPAAPAATWGAADIVVPLAVGGLWLLWFATGLERHAAAGAEASAQRGGSGPRGA